MPSRPALGRGLKALIPDTPRARSGLAEIPLDRLCANPSQPRQRFDEDRLNELAASIREHGILQPLLVGESADNTYVVIAGERRLRAARLAGLTTVPVVIREHLDAHHELELALVENLQRRDLTPLEEARAFEHLRTTLGLSQGEIASRVGIDRSTVANALRLLKLTPPVQELVESGRLSGGHARALLAFSDEDDRLRWARRAADAGLSVRDVERAAAAGREQQPGARRRRPPAPDPNLRAAEEKLSLHLGTKVEIRSQRRGGRIVISCGDQQELMRVFDRLMEGS